VVLTVTALKTVKLTNLNFASISGLIKENIYHYEEIAFIAMCIIVPRL